MCSSDLDTPGVIGKKETPKPDRGLVTVQRSVLNQRGEVVQEGETDLMIERRPRP